MKKTASILIILLFLIILILPRNDFYGEMILGESSIFVLPESLKSIDDEAFSGTAVNTLIFPDGLLSIGNNAFCNSAYLIDVYIPETTIHIADSAFSGSSRFVIHGIDGSYAKKWAQDHQIPFTTCSIWNTSVQQRRIDGRQGTLIERYIQLINTSVFVLIKKRKKDIVRSMRPQDRPELNPIDYRFP